MLPNVLFKTLRDQRRSLPFWGVGLVLLAAFLAGLYPTVRDNNVFQQMVEAYPDELKGLMGLTDSMDISSGVGWLNIEAFGFMVPLVFIVYGVLAGATAIAGEEGRGTLYLLLTEPIERGRVVLEKFGAMALAMGALCVVLYAALAVGAVATGMDDVGMLNLAAITASAALLGLVFGALALAIRLRHRTERSGRRCLCCCGDSGLPCERYECVCGVAGSGQKGLAVLLLQRRRPAGQRVGAGARTGAGGGGGRALRDWVLGLPPARHRRVGPGTGREAAMIIDSHAHAFPPMGGPSGFVSSERHAMYTQHGLGAPPPAGPEILRPDAGT